jgi:hypothetical protein
VAPVADPAAVAGLEVDARGDRSVVARKSDRASSVVILGLPGATQLLLTIAEGRE